MLIVACCRSTPTGIISYTGHARSDTHANARTEPDSVIILAAKRGAAGAVLFERHHVLTAAPFKHFVSIWGHGRCNYHIMRPSDSEL